MGFVDAVKSFFKKYVVFSGRASRSEYWYAMLFLTIINVAMSVATIAFGNGSSANAEPVPPSLAVIVISIVNLVFSLVIAIPSFAIISRRLHDLNKSFWWYLIIFIPIIGIIVLIVWFCRKGTAGDNRFGPDPLAV